MILRRIGKDKNRRSIFSKSASAIKEVSNPDRGGIYV